MRLPLMNSNGTDNTISYCRLTVEGDDSHLTVKDAAGNKRNVLKKWWPLQPDGT